MIVIFVESKIDFYDNILKHNEKDTIKAIENKCYNYSRYKIPKKNGEREIKCIDKDGVLYEIQSNLKDNFLNQIPIANLVFGFVEGYSYKDFLKPHINKEKGERFFIRIDIKKFFPSIRENLLKEVFNYYINIEEDNNLLDHMIEIITLDGSLPQGAVTSPVVSNIVFRQLDLRIQKYCRKLNFKYTRYADDLLFSSSNKKIFENFFIKALKKILNSKNFKINYSKIIKQKSEISLNGFVVGENIRLSRKRKKEINKVLFLYQKNGGINNLDSYIEKLNNAKFDSRGQYGENFKDVDSLIDYLSGYRSFLIQWLPAENKDHYMKHKRLIDKIETLIEDIFDLKEEN